jgi:hypothetical protein
MQECVTLSVAEAELMALVGCIQEMLHHVKDFIEPMGLKVKIPIIFKVDNEGAKYLVKFGVLKDIQGMLV